MTSKLKALGLALVAVFAMSAMAASAAQAAPEFMAQNVGDHIEGEGTSVQIFKSTASSSFKLECQTAHFTGTAAALESTEQTISPKYENCSTTVLGTTYKVDVETNECDYVFHVESEISTMKHEGTTDVVCPAGQSIVVRVTNKEGGTKCTDTISEQAGIGPVTYLTTHTPPDEEKEDIDVISHAENVVNTTSGGLLNCGVANGKHESGVYEGEATVRAYTEPGGAQTNLTVTP